MEAAEAGPASASAPDSSALQAAAAAPKRRNRGNIRKRDADEPSSQHKDEGDEGGGGGDDDDQSAVVRKAKQQRGMAFTNKTERTEDLSGVQYEGSRVLQQGGDSKTFAMLETETELDRDARALREKVLAQGSAEPEDDGTYKGMTGYIDHRKGFRREHNVGSEKGTGSHGPLRANMYVRVSARFDYQPDVCKDYKETGFCSYGDSCKFMHDRGDYKSGWELERDWNAEQKAKLEEKMKGWNPDKEDDDDGEQQDDDDDGLPFACLSCRQPWEDCKNPVVTRCKHYFCERCALKSNSKTGKCDVCGKPTQGIFNVANDIIKKMKKDKQKS